MTGVKATLRCRFDAVRKWLQPSVRDVAPTESGVIKRAEAISGRMPGAAALRIVADDATGELESVTILAPSGDPGGFRRAGERRVRGRKRKPATAQSRAG